MNICMLSELFYPFMLGGAERRYYEIAKRLAKRHDITVYALNLDGSPRKEIVDGIRIIRVGAKHTLNRRRLPPLATYPLAILKALASDYDIFDANQGISSFSGFLRPLTKRPIVATFHDIYWNQWNDYFSFPFSSIGKTMEFLWSKASYSKIMAVSPNTAKKLIRLGFKPPIEVIPSGVDNDFIKKIKPVKDETSVVFVGRLVKYKNIDNLLRAFKAVQNEHPKYKIKIVGTGPEEGNLKKLAKFLNINAEFYGFVSEEEKIRIIKSSNVLVNPSSVEGFGLILIEAMACGTPVVAKNLDTYFFCNKSNSVLYNNDEELENILIELIENKNMAKKLENGGTETSKKYSWDNVTKQVEDLYTRVLT